MRLHYYTTAVPQSYCVGVHNGHGFGSLFAKIFSKVAAKTAAKAAVKVAKTAGRKALKVATTKGVDILKDFGKHAINTGTELGKDLAIQKINSIAQSDRLKNVLGEDIVHSLADTATRGVQIGGRAIANTATKQGEKLLDKGRSRVEAFAGIKRKAAVPKKPTKTTKHPAKKKKKHGKSLTQRMSEYE